jgi:hypothetical protein
MEAEFDKEIDAILRKAHRDGPVLVGDFAGSRHLDADEISAFAENAMPEKSRTLYMAHLAECDRCRKILSNTLSLNQEAVPAAATPSVITIAERSTPWYKRLFMFPNLAYVMGSLVLVFGGFLAFTVVQNTTMKDGATVSQAIESEDPRGGPYSQSEPAFGDVAANSSANSNATTSRLANSSAAANVAGASPGSSPLAEARGPAVGKEKEDFLLDGVSAGSGAPPPAPPPAVSADAQPKDAREADDMKARALAKPSITSSTEAPKNEAVAKQQQYQVNEIPAQSGPSRRNEGNYKAELERMDRQAQKRAVTRDEEASGRRSVAGKTFERKQGVWYDVTYQGRPTINVRRGSDEFNRLEGGLRSIANSLSGTVVVVWGAKAYRIQ